MASESKSLLSAESTALILIYVNIILYALCYQFQRPIEPFMVEKLQLKGDSAEEYAKLQSFFQILQTVGNALM